MKSGRLAFYIVLGLFSLIFAMGAQAANPSLVKDINATALVGSSSPSNLVVMNGLLYFSATTPENGTELWKSDGSASGSVLLKDIFPGADGSSPQNLTVVGTTLYFTADDGSHGRELWKSDGTSAGTVMVRDIASAPGVGSSPSNLTSLGTTLYFSASDGADGEELWKSDGTPGGTVMVSDINPGSGSSSPRYLKVYNGYVYFNGYDPTNGYSLWKSAGVTTSLVKGSEGTNPASLFSNGSYLLFQGYSAAAGYELWFTSGSSASLLYDINPGSASSSPSGMVLLSGDVYFPAYDATYGTSLWRLTSGLSLYRVTGSEGTAPQYLTVLGAYLYYSGASTAGGRELWRASASSAAQFYDLNAGSANANPGNLTVLGGYLYFSATDAVNGTALWRTSGSGVSMVAAAVNPSNLALLGASICFSGYSAANGYELWSSNGTSAALLKNIYPDTGLTGSSSPGNLTLYGSYVYFTASNGVSGAELWRSNGSAGGTTLLADINSGAGDSSPSYLTVMGGYLYFRAYDPVNGYAIWKTDGSSVSMVPGTAGTSAHYYLTAWGANLYFRWYDAVNGNALWKTNGTAAPTMVAGTAGSNPTNMAVLGSYLYFSGYNSASGYELWRTDGNSAALFADINGGTTSSSPAYMTTMGSYLYFRANDGINGNSLWKTDGASPPSMIPGAAGSSPAYLSVFNGYLYYQGYNSASGYELWRANGTSAVLFADINPGPASSSPSQFTVVGATLYFRASDASHGAELWKTDGTTAGTYMAADSVPGVYSGLSNVAMASLGNLLLLSVADPARGSELFVYDTTYPSGSISNLSMPAAGTVYLSSGAVTLNLSCSSLYGTCTQMQFSSDNLNWSVAEAYATSKSWNLAATVEPQVVYVRFMDNLGHWSNSYSIRLLLDQSVPETAIISKPAAVTSSKTAFFSFQSSETATFECWLDEDASGFAACPNPVTYNLFGGTHTLQVRAVDPAGHVDPTPAAWNWMIQDNLGNSAVGWGANTFGQLGNGQSGADYATNPVIVDVAGVRGFTAISAGGLHTLGLRNDGSVWSWGDNRCGQLGNGSQGNTSSIPSRVNGLDSIVSVCAGTWFSLAVQDDGTVWIWGQKPEDNALTNLCNAAPGNVLAPQKVPGLSNIKLVACGDHHALALDGSKNVWSWGQDTVGELGRNLDNSTNKLFPTPGRVTYDNSGHLLANVTAIAAGKSHSLAMVQSGSSPATISAWGGNSSGQLGIASSDKNNRSIATAVATPACTLGAISISAGSSHSAAVYSGDLAACGDATAYAYTWGANFGQLGLGNSLSFETPQKVTGLPGVRQVVASLSNTYFLTEDSSVWVAGSNIYGQIGRGLYDYVYHLTPEKVAYLSGAESITAYGGFALALKTAWITLLADYNYNGGDSSSIAIRPDSSIGISQVRQGALSYVTNAGNSGSWQSENPDPALALNFGTPWKGVQYTSLAIDTVGNPHICYDYFNGTNRVVKYATKASSTWTVETVASLANHTNASGPVGARCSIALNGSNVHVAYSDINNTVSPQCGSLMLASRTAPGSWVATAMDSNCGSYSGLYPALKFDSGGYAHISYSDGFTLKHVKALPGSAPLLKENIGSGGGATHTSLAIDSAGFQQISYCGHSATRGSVLYYASNSPAGTWSASLIDDSETNLCTGGTSLTLKNGDQNSPYIAYYDNVNKDLKVAYLKNGLWFKTAVDTDEDVGQNPSIASDGAGTVHISYRLYPAAHVTSLKYAKNVDFDKPTGSIAIQDGAYTNNPTINLALVCDDASNGIGCWQMKFSDNNGSSWSAPESGFTLVKDYSSGKSDYRASKALTLSPGDGNRIVRVKYEDSANNWSSDYPASVFLDTVKPNGSLTVSSATGYTNNRLVLLNTACSDPGGAVASGCYKMKFNTDSATSQDSSKYSTAIPYQLESSIFLPPGDGPKDVYVIYLDKAGNESIPCHADVKLDVSPPTTTATPPGPPGVKQTASITVTLNCNDNGGSGCAATYYSLDGGVETLYSGPIPISGLKTTPYLLTYHSVDRLGNPEAPRSESYVFEPGVTTLSLDVPPTILQNGKLDVQGKLTRLPDSPLANNGMDLSSLPITLTISGPAGSLCETPCSITQTLDANGQLHASQTYSSLGHYEIKGIDKFSYPGVYTIQANFSGSGLHQPAVSTSQSLLVGASAGYAIIVEGKVLSEEGLNSHNKTTNRVYEALKERGFVDDNIMYLNYGGSMIQGVDGIPAKFGSSANAPGIRWAIQNWAKERMNGAPAPLYLIFVDHGNNNTFYIYPDTIDPAELNSWMANLESGLNDAARLQKRILILGACYSGSFINSLKQAPQPGVDAGRIVISSAAANEQSYKGPNEPDGIRSGEFFIEELFKSLRKGSSLKAAFVEAAGLTRSFTSQGGGAANSANGYHDTAVQHPLLSDSGSGSGSNTLIDGIGEGVEAAKVHLGVGVTNASLGPADIKYVTPTRFLSYAESQAILETEPYSNAAVSSVWLEVKAPATTLSSIPGRTFQLELDLPRWAMTLGGSRWQATYGSDSSRPTEKFAASGKYEVYYFTKSTNAEISEMRRSVVYKNYNGNSAPAPFNLVSPTSGLQVRTQFNMVWSPSSDSDGLSYTLQIAGDPAFQGIVLQKEELENSWYQVGAEAGLKDDTTYYWRVIAVDSFGAATTSSQQWSFHTNNTNDFPGWIKGTVSDTLGARVAAATVDVVSGGTVVAQVNSIDGGVFILPVPPGSYTVSAHAGGYAKQTEVAVNVGSAAVENADLTVIDSAKPLITAFSIPVTAVSATVNITALTASDNMAVNGYCVLAENDAAKCASVWGAAPAQFVFSGLVPGVPTLKTLYAFAVDSVGNVSDSGPSSTASVTITLPIPERTIQTFVIGSGRIYQTPSGLDCSSAPPDVGCSATKAPGTRFDLVAVPANWQYLFSAWSGVACDGGNSATLCGFNLNSDLSVTATFDRNFQARVGATSYSSLQDALAAAASGTTVEAQVYTFMESILFNRLDNAVVSVFGGLGPGYAAPPVGETGVTGSITIKQGTLLIKGPLVVR